MPSVSPLKTGKAFIPSDRPSRYRTAEYHNARDGSTVRIEESRRRTPKVGVAARSRPDHSIDFQLFESLPVRSKEAGLNGQTSRPRTIIHNNPLRWSGAGHVTPVPRAGAKPKAVIIQSRSSATPTGKQKPGFVHYSDVPTPPPTPRFERLPTPELSDLKDGAPFCDCCQGETSMKYCTSCATELDRY
jgi:hypothetical protein